MLLIYRSCVIVMRSNVVVDIWTETIVFIVNVLATNWCFMYLLGYILWLISLDTASGTAILPSCLFNIYINPLKYFKSCCCFHVYIFCWSCFRWAEMMLMFKVCLQIACIFSSSFLSLGLLHTLKGVASSSGSKIYCRSFPSFLWVDTIYSVSENQVLSCSCN